MEAYGEMAEVLQILQCLQYGHLDSTIWKKKLLTSI